MWNNQTKTSNYDPLSYCNEPACIAVDKITFACISDEEQPYVAASLFQKLDDEQRKAFLEIVENIIKAEDQ